MINDCPELRTAASGAVNELMAISTCQVVSTSPRCHPRPRPIASVSRCFLAAKKVSYSAELPAKPAQTIGCDLFWKEEPLFLIENRFQVGPEEAPRVANNQMDP